MKTIRCENNLLNFDEIGAKIILWNNNNTNIIQNFNQEDEDRFSFLMFPFIGKNKHKFMFCKDSKIETQKNTFLSEQKFKTFIYQKDKIGFEWNYQEINELLPILLQVIYQIFKEKLVITIKLKSLAAEIFYYKLGWNCAFKMFSKINEYNFVSTSKEKYIFNNNGLLMGGSKEIAQNFIDNFEKKNQFIVEGEEFEVNSPNTEMMIKTKNLDFLKIKLVRETNTMGISTLSSFPSFVDDSNVIEEKFDQIAPKETKEFKVEIKLVKK